MRRFSALNGRKRIYIGSLDSYESGGNEVFVYDINKGADNRFRRVDVICSQISWRKGYASFMFDANTEMNDGGFVSNT